MMEQQKGSEFFMVMTVLIAVIVGIFIIILSKNPNFAGKASEKGYTTEKCNNIDDNHNGIIDEGCDNDKDTYWNSDMDCEVMYMAGNGQVYLCAPEMMDSDDNNAAIGHVI